MSRVGRRLALLLLLHHIDNVCRPGTPRDAVAEAAKAMVVRSLAVFSDFAAYRLASLPVDAPRRPSTAALPPASRRQRQPLAIEAAPMVVPPVVEQVRQYEEG